MFVLERYLLVDEIHLLPTHLLQSSLKLHPRVGHTELLPPDA